MVTSENKSTQLNLTLAIFMPTRSYGCSQEWEDRFLKCKILLEVLFPFHLNFDSQQREDLIPYCYFLDIAYDTLDLYADECLTAIKKYELMKMYEIMRQLSRDVCTEGDYQDEYLKHTICFVTVKKQIANGVKCSDEYQKLKSHSSTPKYYRWVSELSFGNVNISTFSILLI